MSKGGGEPQPETTGIGLTERVGYGLGDTASNLYFQFFNFFLLYYYTDVFGLNAAAVGTMYLVANLWDAVNDPLMGAIADRTRTRHGLYRPYLLWFALPYGFFGYLIFANPSGLGETGKLAFAYVTFIAFKMVYTAINIPYSAMMGVMTSDARERIELSAARFLGAFGGGFMVSLLVRPLVKVFGGDDEVAGFQGTMALFGVLSVVMFLVTFFTTRERVPPLVEKVDVLTDLKILSQNRPWLFMIAAAVCTLASVAVRGAVTVHFFKYVVGASDEALFALGAEGSAFRLEFDATTLFLSASSLSFIVGVA
ncbi:MAG: glycoside-pentoside-hexuronide (GPH):cation symporter, partial [Myxococcota bacterium]